jgi:hypothetical protein
MSQKKKKKQKKLGSKNEKKKTHDRGQHKTDLERKQKNRVRLRSGTQIWNKMQTRFDTQIERQFVTQMRRDN